MKKTYCIDFKVFESMMTSEVPFMLPPEMVRGDRVVVGSHSVQMQLTQNEFDELYFWCGQNSGMMKIIGDRIMNEIMAKA